MYSYKQVLQKSPNFTMFLVILENFEFDLLYHYESLKSHFDKVELSDLSFFQSYLLRIADSISIKLLAESSGVRTFRRIGLKTSNI
jgi:hypothetical protein